ncbi:MAG: RnfABCDGE type electron transport complex subunit G [Candidatus Saganbacteria bacterium]|nr:RnfABCDGE type electron transport complex subunit G [Candidatus Saganbacteria bacterium]
MNVKDILKLGIFLMVVGAVAGIALSLTYIFTAPQIAEQKKIEINGALREILPEATEFTEVKKAIGGKEEIFYFGLKEGSKVGAAFFSYGKGYGGTIEMIVGINKDGKVSGVKIISQKETPGLGAKANDPRFLDQFKGKSETDRLKAKEDIQAITGATITSQGIANGVREALEKFRAYY